MEHMIKELSVCSFIPCDFEFDIKNSSDITPVEIALKDGKKAILQGSIDRVDMYSKNGEKYIRVVDYKSGTKDFNLNEVYYGLNMQMLIYLFSLWFSGKNKYENCSPAGILYMPAGESSVLSDRHSTDSDIIDAKNSSYKMKGLLLGDIDILEKMESPLKGVFIPAKIDEKSGDISSKSIISADNFATLKNHIDKLLYSMAEHIYKGDAKILPSKNGDFLSCEFCDYKDVCGREENDDFKEIESFSTTEAIERMEGENG
jgi:ATP-dependent helicase/nuclease subunit B